MNKRASSPPNVVWTILVVAGLTLLAPTAASIGHAIPTMSQDDKLIPDDVEPGDRFAQAIAVDDDHLILGDTGDRENGQVHIYDRTGGALTLEATLTAPDGTKNMGEALALQGSTLVVGAPSTDVDGSFAAGVALVYEEISDGTWEHVETLASPDPGGIERYGSSLALEADLLVVGEPEDEVPGEWDSNGAVHIYEHDGSGYALDHSLFPPDDPDRERFGFTLGLHDGTLLVGAPEDETEAGEGAIYVYDPAADGWEEADRLVPPAESEARAFARAMAVDDGTLVVGAPGPQAQICCSPLLSGPQGQAFIYTLADDGTWAYDQELQPALATSGSSHGLSVAVDAGAAYVAAPSAPRDTVVGTVSVFEDTETGWQQTDQVLADDPASGDQLGLPVAAHDGTLVASAPGDDEGGHDAGAVYLFTAGDDPGDGDDPAPEQCTSPDEGIEVCDTDEDPSPERVTVETSLEGVAALNATYLDRTWWGWTLHELVLHVDPNDDGPLGANDTTLRLTCWEAPDDELVCNDADAQLVVGEPGSHEPILRVDANCRWLSTADGTLCGTLRTRGAADLAGQEASTSVLCGGGFGSSCPDTVRSSAGQDTSLGSQSVHLNLRPNGAGICATGDLADAGCVGLPP